MQQEKQSMTAQGDTSNAERRRRTREELNQQRTRAIRGEYRASLEKARLQCHEQIRRLADEARELGQSHARARIE
jgi:hypothetical protein